MLFIIADDMRPQLGCYGHGFMHTPHIDQLAATGTLFTRAFVQHALCAPSRNSKRRCHRLSRPREHFSFAEPHPVSSTIPSRSPGVP